MNQVVKNFIPIDTRLIEIQLSVTLFCIGIFLLFTHKLDTITDLTEMWGIICIVTSLIHLAAIALHPTQLFARVASLWGAGSIWIYFSLNYTKNSFGIITMFLLGVGCFAAFVINTIIISEIGDKKWMP